MGKIRESFRTSYSPFVAPARKLVRLDLDAGSHPAEDIPDKTSQPSGGESVAVPISIAGPMAESGTPALLGALTDDESANAAALVSFPLPDVVRVPEASAGGFFEIQRDALQRDLLALPESVSRAESSIDHTLPVTVRERSSTIELRFISPRGRTPLEAFRLVVDDHQEAISNHASAIIGLRCMFEQQASSVFENLRQVSHVIRVIGSEHNSLVSRILQLLNVVSSLPSGSTINEIQRGYSQLEDRLENTLIRLAQLEERHGSVIVSAESQERINHLCASVELLQQTQLQLSGRIEHLQSVPRAQSQLAQTVLSKSRHPREESLNNFDPSARPVNSASMRDSHIWMPVLWILPRGSSAYRVNYRVRCSATPGVLRHHVPVGFEVGSCACGAFLPSS